MIRQDSATKILQLIATAACDVTVTGSDKTSTAYTGFSQETAATASTQTISNAPAASTVRDTDRISIKNGASANTLTLQMYNSSGAVTTPFDYVVLAANETYEYENHAGSQTKDATGARKVGTAGWVIAAGKIGTLSNSLTFAGTDGSTLNIGTGGTLGTAAYTASTAYEAAGGIATHAALQTGVHGISITAGKTLTVTESITFAGTDATVMTFPGASGTVATLNAANVFTNVLSVTDATDAASATSASLKTAGGIASVKGAWIGGTSRLVGNVQMDGTLGLGAAAVNYIAFNITKTTTGAGTSHYGIVNDFTGSASGTSNLVGQLLSIHTTAAAYTVITGTGLLVGGAALGAASAITNLYGIRVLDQTVGTTLNVGYESAVSSGTGKWNFYGSGTAQNAFAGNVRIGSVTAPTVALDVTGAALISTTMTVTGGFGCNTKAAQTAYASGGALAAYGAGANGFDTGANASALHAMVVSIRAALVANGIMS